MIRGSTRVLAIVGHPVAHSLSPEMHNAACAALGLDAVYVALDVDPSALPNVLRGFEAVGISGNVTVPHKIQAANLLFRKTDIATDLEAVNTFWPDGNRLIGDNTDVAGVLDAVHQLDAPGPWLVAGTGGSARAVAAAARDVSTTLLVQSRDARRASDFVAWARRIGVDAVDDDGRQIGTAINATPLGLHSEDPLPIAPDRLAGCAAALDLVYAPGETRWCDTLRTQGLRVADGRLMLVGQGLGAFRRFFPDVDPPREVMKAAVERALNR
jgi:shikimate dehydrogenase